MKQIKYTEVNGTFYHADTSKDIINYLEVIKAKGFRVRFHWGDTKTGKDWGDTYDVCGTIGRSTGTIKIPLLINNARSMGGGALLDDCIVKITYANKKEGGVLYQHPKYHV
jgi:hypothetical protein